MVCQSSYNSTDHIISHFWGEPVPYLSQCPVCSRPSVRSCRRSRRPSGKLRTLRELSPKPSSGRAGTQSNLISSRMARRRCPIGLTRRAANFQCRAWIGSSFPTCFAAGTPVRVWLQRRQKKRSCSHCGPSMDFPAFLSGCRASKWTWKWRWFRWRPFPISAVSGYGIHVHNWTGSILLPQNSFYIIWSNRYPSSTSSWRDSTGEVLRQSS